MSWPPADAPWKPAGDVDVLLLDKTGTITLGNRQATEFIPAPGVKIEELAEAAQLASLADETPEGRSIAVLAKEKYGLRGREVGDRFATFVPFTAQTRMSGVDLYAEPQVVSAPALQPKGEPVAAGHSASYSAPAAPERVGGRIATHPLNSQRRRRVHRPVC